MRKGRKEERRWRWKKGESRKKKEKRRKTEDNDKINNLPNKDIDLDSTSYIVSYEILISVLNEIQHVYE